MNFFQWLLNLFKPSRQSTYSNNSSGTTWDHNNPSYTPDNHHQQDHFTSTAHNPTIMDSGSDRETGDNNSFGGFGGGQTEGSGASGRWDDSSSSSSGFDSSSSFDSGSSSSDSSSGSSSSD